MIKGKKTMKKVKETKNQILILFSCLMRPDSVLEYYNNQYPNQIFANKVDAYLEVKMAILDLWQKDLDDVVDDFITYCVVDKDKSKDDLIYRQKALKGWLSITSDAIQSVKAWAEDLLKNGEDMILDEYNIRKGDGNIALQFEYMGKIQQQLREDLIEIDVCLSEVAKHMETIRNLNRDQDYI